MNQLQKPTNLDWPRDHLWAVKMIRSPFSSPLTPQAKKKKNISHDAFGTKFGRVHMQKQDLSKLQTRKMKGLRKRKAADVDANADEQEGHAPKSSKVDS